MSQAFSEPERRVIRYAVIGPEQTGQAGAATPQEIERVYRANQARFGPRETRTLQHLIVADRAQAQQAAQRLRGGASFAEVASGLGFAASDLTFANQSRESFGRQAPAPVVAAAFSTAQGQIGGPVAAEGAFHLVRVEVDHADTGAEPRIRPVRDRCLHRAAQARGCAERVGHRNSGPDSGRRAGRADRAGAEADIGHDPGDHRRRPGAGRHELADGAGAGALARHAPSAWTLRIWSPWSSRSAPPAATP